MLTHLASAPPQTPGTPGAYPSKQNTLIQAPSRKPRTQSLSKTKHSACAPRSTTDDGRPQLDPLCLARRPTDGHRNKHHRTRGRGSCQPATRNIRGHETHTQLPIPPDIPHQCRRLCGKRDAAHPAIKGGIGVRRPTGAADRNRVSQRANRPRRRFGHPGTSTTRQSGTGRARWRARPRRSMRRRPRPSLSPEGAAVGRPRQGVTVGVSRRRASVGCLRVLSTVGGSIGL